MTTQPGPIENRPTEGTTLHFNLPSTTKKAYTFNHSMTSIRLEPHTPKTLAAARRKTPLLRAIADEHLTHFVDVELPSDCIVMTYVTTERVIDGVTVQHPVHFGLHVPRRGRAAAKTLFQSRNNAAGVHPKLERLGLTAGHITAATEGAVDPEFPSHIETFQDATDAAVGLLFQHGSLINLSAENGGEAPAIIEQHILNAIQRTQELPLTILMLGDNWLETTVVKIPDTDKTTTQTSPVKDVLDMMAGPLREAIAAVQNDLALQGIQWNINYGVTTDDYGSRSAISKTEEHAITLSRELLEAGADKWTSANKSVMNGLSVDGGVTYTAPPTKAVWSGEGVWSASDVAPNKPLQADYVTALNEGNMFIQVTSPAFASGLLRGKLVKQNTNDTTGITKFTAELTGAGVVPAVSTKAKGKVTAELNSGGTGISYKISVQDVGDENISAGFYVGKETARAGEQLYKIELGNQTGLGSLTFNVTNKWLRHLSACVEYRDASGNVLTPKGWSSKIPAFLRPIFEPNANKPFVELIPPVSTVFGIPLPAYPTTITIPMWDEVASVRILMGGLGRGDYDTDVCPIGITVTALAELALPVFLLFAGTSVSCSKTVESILADKEVLFAICAAGAFLVGGGSATYIMLSQDPGRAAEKLAILFGPMLLSPATSLGRWVAGKIVQGAAERSAPFVNIALLVLNGAVTAAQLAQTTIEVLSSPFVYETVITRSMDLKVTLTPDERFHKFPDHHDYMQLKVVYDSGSTQPVYTRYLPATTLSDPITVNFFNVPAGGKLKVFAFFFAANGWQSGQGNTDWLRATATSGSTMEVNNLMVTTNQIPLSKDSKYIHQAKITMVGNKLDWQAAVNNPPVATVTTPSPFPRKEILRLGNVTFAQQPEMIGYSWQASGLNLSPDTENNPRTNDPLWTVQNMSVLQHPDKGYAIPKVGFTHQPGVAYNMASADDSDTNFWIDPSNSGFNVDYNLSGGYHVRGVKLGFNSPPPSFSTTSNQSYGRFPFMLDKYIYHPAGYIIGISFTTDKLYRLELLDKPVADKDAPHAVMSSGTGTRDGLIKGPTGLAVALDGRILVLESRNARVQAFDIFGNPVRYFAGTGADKSSVLNLKPRANSTYLDISVESQGYIYVLSYTGDGSSPDKYQVDLYKPDGEFLVTTPNVAAAKMVVDILRNMFTLNYETIQDGAQRIQPTLSMWLPPAPSPVALVTAEEALEAEEIPDGTEENPAEEIEIKEFHGKWRMEYENTKWSYPSQDGFTEDLNLYTIGKDRVYPWERFITQTAINPKRTDVDGPEALYYGSYVTGGAYCTSLAGVERRLRDAFPFWIVDSAPFRFIPTKNPVYGSTWDLFDMGHGGRCYGFNSRSVLPPIIPRRNVLVLPGTWQIRHHLGGVAPSFSDFRYINLAKNNMSGFTMFNSKYYKADLKETNFNDAKLQGSDFSDCYRITGATFRNAKLQGCKFDNVDLSNIDFSGADLSGVNLSLCRSVAGAKFIGANLSGTNFKGLADFTNTDFTGAIMKGTLFYNSNLSPAKFADVTQFADTQDARTEFVRCTIPYNVLKLNWNYLNMTSAVVTGMPKDMQRFTAQNAIIADFSFISTNLKNANFTNAILPGCSFAECGLPLANFRGAQLQGRDRFPACAFSRADLMNVDFTEANLTGTNFTGAYFWGTGAKVTNAILIRAIFSNAYLAGVDFSGVAEKQCQGAIFDYSCLVNAKFMGTNVGKLEGQSASFVRACLQGVDFTGASLDAANFTSAAVAQTTGSFPVTIKMGWPMRDQDLPIPYNTPTIGFEAATTTNTLCPDTEKGQCTIDKQRGKDAPTKWPVTTYLADGTWEEIKAD